MNKKISTVRPELFPVPVKSPWYHLGMDFVGPISPPSRSGNRYILTISDYFTKFGWAKALQSKEASNVVGALREVRLMQCMIIFYTFSIIITRSVARFARLLLACACISFVYILHGRLLLVLLYSMSKLKNNGSKARYSNRPSLIINLVI